MPFTFAHPAVVLPLRKICATRASFWAAILGSMAPDFGYYIHWWQLGSFAHSLIGSVLVDIPISLLFLLVVFKVQTPVANLLPQPHKDFWIAKPIDDNHQFKWAGSSIIRLSAFILVGAWSHIAWDSLTHSSGWCVLAAPKFFMQSVGIENFQIPVFKLFQYGSSLIGVCAIIVFYWRRLKTSVYEKTSEEKTRDAHSVLRLGLIFTGSALLCAAFSYTHFAMTADRISLRESGFVFLINWISSFVVILVVTALVNQSTIQSSENQETKKPPR
jgi:hypothetical protein